MGTLVAKRYSTPLFADLADHTYVECGTGGKGWSCWGGKQGGTRLHSGAGSTKRADEIAQPDERAGITCYLINGVCHQAANRILLPAGITVQGARGYGVSEALFGTYGRPIGALGTCQAPFDQRPDVTDDLSECTEMQPSRRKQTRRETNRDERAFVRRYLRGVLSIYRKGVRLFESLGSKVAANPGPELEPFYLELFKHQVRFRLRSDFDSKVFRRLGDIRLSTERARLQLEEWFARQELTAIAFANAFNKETILFQEAVASLLPAKSYRALFDVKRGETVILGNPSIVRRAYGKR